MKLFISSLVAFAAIISVRSDEKFNANIRARYNTYNETGIKEHIDIGVKKMETMMRAAAVKDMTEDLQYMAKDYENIILWANTALAKAYKALESVNATERHQLLVEVAIRVEKYLFKGEKEEKVRAVNTLKVTDTEENLMKKFNEITDNVRAQLTMAMNEEKTRKEAWFWVLVHQSIIEIMDNRVKDFKTYLTTLKTSDIRAKNLQVMLNDLDVMLADPHLDQYETTFFAKVEQKFGDFVSKIKSIFV